MFLDPGVGRGRALRYGMAEEAEQQRIVVDVEAESPDKAAGSGASSSACPRSAPSPDELRLLGCELEATAVEKDQKEDPWLKGKDPWDP